jgi:hypothetical protein
MYPTPRTRIVVEMASTGAAPSEQRLRRKDATYLRDVPLPDGVLARGHVVGPLTLSDLEAVISGCTTIIPTTLVIEHGRPRGDVTRLPFTAMNFDGAVIEGTLDIRPATTALGAPKLVVDVVLRANDDEDGTDHRADGPPPAAVLGAVLAELRDLRHRLRTTPTTVRQAVDHVEAILAAARELEDAQDGGLLRESSRSAASWTARRVAARYAGVILRGVPKEEVISQCSDGSTVSAAEVHELLRADGHDVDAIAFLDPSWPGQVPFVATRTGAVVVNGTVVIDCTIDGDTIRAFAEIRIDEVVEPNGYSVSARASLSAST